MTLVTGNIQEFNGVGEIQSGSVSFIPSEEYLINRDPSMLIGFTKTVDFGADGKFEVELEGVYTDGVRSEWFSYRAVVRGIHKLNGVSTPFKQEVDIIVPNLDTSVAFTACIVYKELPKHQKDYYEALIESLDGKLAVHVAAAEKARDEAEAFAAATEALQDAAVTGLLQDNNSATSKAALGYLLRLDEVHISALMASTGLGFEAALRHAVSTPSLARRKIVLPAGDFTLTDVIDLPSGTVIVGQGANTVIRKTGNYVVFLAHKKSGIVLQDITFVGRIDSGGGGICALWGVNSSDIYVSNIVAEYAVADGHVFDLQGCSNVVVEKSTFSGKTASNKHYSEAIQIDHSVRTGASGIIQADMKFDGAACRNITVRDCQALAIGSFPAPHLVGSHSMVENRPHSDVTIENNLSERPPTVGANFRTGMSFQPTERLTVANNRFLYAKGTGDLPNAVIQVHVPATVTALADVDKSSSEPIPVPRMEYLANIFGNRCDVPNIEQVFGGYLTLTSPDARLGSYGVGPRLYLRAGVATLVWYMRISAANQGWANSNFNNGLSKLIDIPREARPPVIETHVCSGPFGRTNTVQIGVDGVISLGEYSDASYPSGTDLNFKVVTSWQSSI